MMRAVFSILLVTAILGCSIPGLGRCEQEFVAVAMQAILTSTSSQTLNLSSEISESNIPSDFTALSGVVRNAAIDQGPDEIVWDLSQGFPEQGFASFSLALPVQRGQLITLDDPAFRGGGWAIRYQRPPFPARAGLQLGTFLADTVSGTILVLDADPLQLRVDLQFVDENRTLSLTGDMVFRVFSETETCD
jgi:hypothetical protein